MDAAMREMAGSDWDPAAGVVRRYGTLRYLEGVVADEGDSLACLAPLTLKNWGFMAWRARDGPCGTT